MRAQTPVLLAVMLAMFTSAAGCGPAAVLPENELVRLWDEPSSLDPHLASDADSAAIIIEVFGGLVTLDRNLEIVPDLAESWDISPDGRTYTFTIRPDATFHDGRPVTAGDFKWSFERAADPRTESPTVDTYLGDIVGVREKLRGEADEVAGVREIDDRTLEITIDSPKVYFLAKLTYPTAFVLDRANVEARRNWFMTPNGTGPFRLKEYIPSQLVVLERNPLFHLGMAKLDRVRFLLAGGTPMVMYEANEIHVAGVGLNDLHRVRDPSSPLSNELHRAPPGFQLSYIGLNVSQPPLDDINVRQALALSINKGLISNRVLEDLLIPAWGILPPGFPGYNPDLVGLRYDIDRARALLAESKYGQDPKQIPRITLTVAGQLGSAVGPDLQAILAGWRDHLGINVDIQQMEFATFLNELHNFRLQMYAAAWIADYPDPQNFLDLLFHSGSLNNETRYSNPEVDRLLEAARTETDEARRFRLYHQAEEMIIDDAPLIPLWHPGEGNVLIKPQVRDFLLLPVIIPRYRYVYLESETGSPVAGLRHGEE